MTFDPTIKLMVVDVSLLEEGVLRLQGLFRSLSRNQDFQEDIAPLFEKHSSSAPVVKGRNADVTIGKSKKNPENNAGEQARELTVEDHEILNDFVSESLENLASIEVRLIDLKDDPENPDTINTIFRPFHTIKGVSGFLNLEKINRTENSHVTPNGPLKKHFSKNGAVGERHVETLWKTSGPHHAGGGYRNRPERSGRII